MGTIVVGVDGSAGARDALAFAAAEARVRGARLRVVSAWMVPLFEGMPMPIIGGFPVDYGRPLDEVLDEARKATSALIDKEVDDVLGAEPGIEIERVPLEGSPSVVLIDSARDADLLVVGSRGRGGFAGLLLGSVSQQCAHHAPCPIVIVPPARAR